jgi:predicted dehydrogenase
MYKFAIIGCGRIAHRHAENIRRIGELIAVCDIDFQKANSFAAQYQSKPYYSIDDLLENEKTVDVVVVCSPNGYTQNTALNLYRMGNMCFAKNLCVLP